MGIVSIGISKGGGPLKPPSGAMDRSDIERPTGSMDEAVRLVAGCRKPLGGRWHGHTKQVLRCTAWLCEWFVDTKFAPSAISTCRVLVSVGASLQILRCFAEIGRISGMCAHCNLVCIWVTRHLHVSKHARPGRPSRLCGCWAPLPLKAFQR